MSNLTNKVQQNNVKPDPDDVKPDNAKPDSLNSEHVKQTHTNASSRRSFLRKASIGAPVIVASSAKPAWATAQCMSGMMSGNLSNHEHTCDLTSNNAKDNHYWKHKYVGYFHKREGKSKEHECNLIGIRLDQYDTYKNRYYFWDHYANRALFLNIKRGHSMGDYRMKELLNKSELFYHEVAAARLNAATCTLDPGCIMYPYSVQDVDQIYVDALLMNSYEKLDDVGRMLKGIRMG